MYVSPERRAGRAGASLYNRDLLCDRVIYGRKTKTNAWQLAASQQFALLSVIIFVSSVALLISFLADNEKSVQVVNNKYLIKAAKETTVDS